jgi:hypothetical protein
MPEVKAQGSIMIFDIKTNELSINHWTPELIKKIEEQFS